MKTIYSWKIKSLPKPNPALLKRMVKRAAELSRLDINRNWTAGILFLTDRVMAKYNAEFLQHSGTTDVITFSYLDDGYGDDGDTAVELAIGVEVAWREGCQRANSSYPEELTLYIVHGLLHAAGEDDLNPPAKRRMRRREHQVMTQLKKEFNLNEIFPEIGTDSQDTVKCRKKP